MVIDVMCRASLRSCKKAPHNLGHAKQWRERHPNRIGADIGSGERLAVDVHWRLFIEPDPTQRLTLEFLAARKIAFQADYRLAAGDVIDFDAVEQVGNAAGGDQLGDCVFWNCASADSSRTPDQHALHGIADNLSGNATCPADCRPLKALTGPPLRIAPGGVHCGLKTAR